MLFIPTGAQVFSFLSVQHQQTKLYCTHTVFDVWLLISVIRQYANFMSRLSSSSLSCCCCTVGYVSESHKASKFWINSFCVSLSKLEDEVFENASPLLITLISVSVIVFHPPVFSCALVLIVQVSRRDTRGSAAYNEVKIFLKVSLIALLLWLEEEFICIWFSLMFSFDLHVTNPSLCPFKVFPVSSVSI